MIDIEKPSILRNAVWYSTICSDTLLTGHFPFFGEPQTGMVRCIECDDPTCTRLIFLRYTNEWTITHDGSLVLLYMVTFTSKITQFCRIVYTSTMEHMGKNHHCPCQSSHSEWVNPLSYQIGPDVRPKQAGIRLYRCQVPAMLQAGGFPPRKRGPLCGPGGRKIFHGHFVAMKQVQTTGEKMGCFY